MSVKTNNPKNRCSICGKRISNCEGHIEQYTPSEEAEWYRQYDNCYCYDNEGNWI